MYQDHSLGYCKRNSRSSMFRIVPKFKKEKAAKKTSPQSGRVVSTVASLGAASGCPPSPPFRLRILAALSKQRLVRCSSPGGGGVKPKIPPKTEKSHRRH